MQPPETVSTFKLRVHFSENRAFSKKANARCRIANRFFAIVLLSLLSAGCGTHDIETDYGRRNSQSVNGTAVLGEMFELAGHHVFSWRVLSPRVWERADAIVWFPDDFEPPTPEVRKWLENWLRERAGRTLIYVGRDFDAAPWYWRRVLPDAPTEQRGWIQEQLSLSETDYQLERRKKNRNSDGEWFTIEQNDDRKNPLPVRRPETFGGATEWLRDVHAAGTGIELRSRLSPAEAAEVLLGSGDDVLVSRNESYGEGRLIVVANGSFLLNLPLVNHEHRRLAARLIREVGPPGKTVVFLESSSGGPPIHREDPRAQTPTGTEIFNVWPASWILLHLAAVGVIFCFSRWPIFGRPKSGDVVRVSDFERHIDAVADLLKRSHDRKYATEKIASYRKTGEP